MPNYTLGSCNLEHSNKHLLWHRRSGRGDTGGAPVPQGLNGAPRHVSHIHQSLKRQRRVEWGEDARCGRATRNRAMQDEQIFRVILVLGFAAIFPVGLYHRLKANAAKEKLDRREEGIFILLTLRPIAGVRMLGMLAYLIHPPWMAWSSVGLPLWLRWIGVLFGMAAATLLIVTFRTLGRNITDTVVTRARHELVTCGPYRWVRHPFYVAFGMATVADSLVTANWFLAATGAVTIALIVIRTRTEEEKLVDRFGDSYRRYMERTGRFIPRLKK